MKPPAKHEPEPTQLDRIEALLSGTLPRQPTIDGYAHHIFLPLTESGQLLLLRVECHAGRIDLRLRRNDFPIWATSLTYIDER